MIGAPVYTPTAGDLVRVSGRLSGHGSWVLHLIESAAVFEVVSVSPLKLSHTCEPPIDVEPSDLHRIEPVRVAEWRSAKLAYGVRVRTNSHDHKTNGIVGYVGKPRGTMGPFRYCVYGESRDGVLQKCLGSWRPEYLICVAPPPELQP